MASEEEKKDLLNQLEERTSARGLLNYAVEYYSSYELIQVQRPKFTDYFSVKYYLLCHSIELTMKAWLRKKGVTNTELKRMGHDLEKIMTVLHDNYNLLFDAKSQAMIRIVNAHYSQKEFEYSVRGAKTVPDISDLATTTHLLISKAKFDIINDGDPSKLREQS